MGTERETSLRRTQKNSISVNQNCRHPVAITQPKMMIEMKREHEPVLHTEIADRLWTTSGLLDRHET